MLAARKMLAAVLLLSLSPVMCRGQDNTTYIKPTDVDWQSALTDPPAVGSDEFKKEIDTLLNWQAKRTDSDTARAKSEEKITVFLFSDVLGDAFKKESDPLTADLFEKVTADASAVADLTKAKWNRQRPSVADDRIHPAVKVPKSSSYPSWHATRGELWARVLGEMLPEKKELLLKRGRQVGDDRVIAGVHFPSDVAAGQKLGDLIFDKLDQSAAYHSDLDKAKEELKNLSPAAKVEPAK